jgi:hypothetical protein
MLLSVGFDKTCVSKPDAPKSAGLVQVGCLLIVFSEE